MPINVKELVEVVERNKDDSLSSLTVLLIISVLERKSYRKKSVFS